MRSSLLAALSAAALLSGSVNADDAQKILSDAKESVSSVASDASSVVESATSSALQLPTFTVSQFLSCLVPPITLLTCVRTAYRHQG